MEPQDAVPLQGEVLVPDEVRGQVGGTLGLLVAPSLDGGPVDGPRAAVPKPAAVWVLGLPQAHGVPREPDEQLGWAGLVAWLQGGGSQAIAHVAQPGATEQKHAVPDGQNSLAAPAC